MPRGDQTGPQGAGPMTGRKAGYCTGSAKAGWQTPVTGGFGRAFHRGGRFHGSPRGLTFGRKYRAAIPPDTELNRTVLQAERDALRSRLAAVEQELSALKENAEK